MSIDLEKLTPAPWESSGCYVDGPSGAPHDQQMHIYDEGGHSETDAEFIALSRNAFDVMMRRRFSAIKVSDGVWSVSVDGNALGTTWIGITGTSYADITGNRLEWSDPFTALVEANKWYMMNVEGKG